MVSARAGEAKLINNESKRRLGLTGGFRQTSGPRRDQGMIALRGLSMSYQDYFFFGFLYSVGTVPLSCSMLAFAASAHWPLGCSFR